MGKGLTTTLDEAEMVEQPEAFVISTVYIPEAVAI